MSCDGWRSARSAFRRYAQRSILPIQPKITAVVRIGLLKDRMPSLPEKFLFFAGRLGPLLLFMDQAGALLQDDLEARLAHPQAEIHVRQVRAEGIVESADRFKNLFAGHQAGTRHGGNVARVIQPAPIVALKKPAARIARAAWHAGYDARM